MKQITATALGQNTRQAEPRPQWDQLLPDDWRHVIDAPLYFAQYVEYEMSADRCIGYDADDQACYTAHRFELTSPASDDDEDFYEVVSYREELAAWRLRDERWLVFRRVTNEACSAPTSFYAISPEMPR